MEVSSWKRCDFLSFYLGGGSPLAQHLWMEVQVIHSFIRSPTAWGLRQQWGKMWCLSLYTLRKSNNRQIFTQTVNGDSDQCYKEAVKDAMGVLNREAWSPPGGSRRHSWSKWLTFEMARIRWTELLKERSQVQCFWAERNQRYHLVMSSLYIPVRKLSVGRWRDLPD